MNISPIRGARVLRRGCVAACFAAALHIAACTDGLAGPDAVYGPAVISREFLLAQIAVADVHDRVVATISDRADRARMKASLHAVVAQLERGDAAAAVRAVEQAERMVTGDVANPDLAAIDLALGAVRARLGAPGDASTPDHH